MTVQLCQRIYVGTGRVSYPGPGGLRANVSTFVLQFEPVDTRRASVVRCVWTEPKVEYGVTVAVRKFGQLVSIADNMIFQNLEDRLKFIDRRLNEFGIER